MSYKTLFSSKIVILLLLIFLGLMTDLKYKQWKNQKAIEKEKQNLSLQIDSLQKKNSDLNASLEYLNSKNFKERAARDQLNLKRSGELVYNFIDAAGQDHVSQQQSKSNLRKWWEYFMGGQ